MQRFPKLSFTSREEKRDEKKIMAFCLAIVLCLTGINDYVVSRAEDSQRKNVALAENGTSIFIDKPHAWGQENGRDIKKMIDGNRNTFGQGNTGNDVNSQINLTLEFPCTYTVDSIVLYGIGPQGFPEEFTVSAYTQEGWKQVASVKECTYQETGNTVNLDAPVDCVGIRITITKNGVDGEWGGQLYLSEFEVYGVESDVVILRENAAAAANGAKIRYDRETADISKMIDGETAGDVSNLGIIGVEDEATETYITVDFEGSYHIDTVRLYGDNRKFCFPKDFTIEAFSGGEWKTVCTVTGSELVGDCNDYPFDGIDCTAIRLHITKNGMENSEGWQGYAIYLSELEAWGTAIAGNVALASKGTKASTSDPNDWAEKKHVSIRRWYH